MLIDDWAHSGDRKEVLKKWNKNLKPDWGTNLNDPLQPKIDLFLNGTIKQIVDRKIRI